MKCGALPVASSTAMAFSLASGSRGTQHQVQGAEGVYAAASTAHCPVCTTVPAPGISAGCSHHPPTCLPGGSPPHGSGRRVAGGSTPDPAAGQLPAPSSSSLMGESSCGRMARQHSGGVPTATTTPAILSAGATHTPSTLPTAQALLGAEPWGSAGQLWQSVSIRGP